METVLIASRNPVVTRESDVYNAAWHTPSVRRYSAITGGSLGHALSSYETCMKYEHMNLDLVYDIQRISLARRS